MSADDKKTRTRAPDTSPAQNPASKPASGAVPSTAPTDRPPAASSSADVDAFLARVKQLAPQTTTGRGRLVFAMDATMSRQPTWDMALALQAEMFHAVAEVGGLDVQLVFFRGAGECQSSKWVSDPDALARLMTTVQCRGGYTQIGKVLSHARQETEKRKINALVYVGDCMEEAVDDLCGRAGELALHGVPVFLFQEGHDRTAETRVPRDRPADQGCLVRLRPGLGRSAPRAAAGGGGLCLRRAGGTDPAAARRAMGPGAQLLLSQMKRD